MFSDVLLWLCDCDLRGNDMQNYYDIDVKHLEEDGLFLPMEKMEEETKTTIKHLLMDAVCGFVAGLHSIPDTELAGLKEVLKTEPENVRPFWPDGAKTGLEMAAFLNSYCLRYPDLTDTLRMIHPKLDAGGHPSDMMAAIFTLCDTPEVTGKTIIECINLGYQMWYLLANGMLTDRNYDSSTALSFVVPVIYAVGQGASPKKVQNALNLSVASGIILGRVRSTDDMTNLKSAAAGYATAKSLWCYRMSDVIEAPATIFTGDRGSWYKVVGPIDRPFKGIGQNDLYQMIELKSYPCFNVAQAPVECAVSLHRRLNGDLSHVEKVVLKKSAVEARIPFRPDRPKYPMDHPTADHHMEYCVGTGLLYGALSPSHYGDTYIQSEEIKRIIDMTELKVFTEEELKALGGNTGGCSLEVYLRDGSVMKEIRRHSKGNVIGTNSSERNAIMQKIVAEKSNMLKKYFACDLSGVAKIIYNFEKHKADELIDAVRSAIKGNEER